MITLIRKYFFHGEVGQALGQTAKEVVESLFLELFERHVAMALRDMV